MDKSGLNFYHTRNNFSQCQNHLIYEDCMKKNSNFSNAFCDLCVMQMVHFQLKIILF